MKVYRFNDRVAVSLESGGTAYLPWRLANAIGLKMRQCAYDIKDTPEFTDSTFKSTEFDANSEWYRNG